MPKLSKWFKTKYPGVRYREHPERKHGVDFDRYYAIQYRMGKIVKNEGLGWGTEGMKAEEAARILGELRRAQKVGEGPQTLNEKREIEEARRKEEQEEQARKEKEAVTFSEIFTESYFPLAKTKTKWTWAREDSLFRLWIQPVIGNKPLKEIAPFDLERIKKNMAEAGNAPRSAHYALAVIRQVFNFARNHSIYTGENPVSKVKKPTNDNSRLRFLSHEEANLLLQALAARSTKAYEMALLSLQCGLRASEIFHLTWGDIDLERNTLTLRDPKGIITGFSRMTKDIRTLFQGKVKGSWDELVFPGQSGVVIKSITSTFAKVVQEVGFNKGVSDRRQRICFHSLRHTFASWHVEAGTDLYTLGKLMHHKTVSMTQRYAHLGENALMEATRRLEESLEDAKKGEVIELTR